MKNFLENVRGIRMERARGSLPLRFHLTAELTLNSNPDSRLSATHLAQLFVYFLPQMGGPYLAYMFKGIIATATGMNTTPTPAKGCASSFTTTFIHLFENVTVET